MVSLYMKIDQVLMLQNMYSVAEVGAYNTVASIKRSLEFYSGGNCNLLFPAILNARRDDMALLKTYPTSIRFDGVYKYCHCFSYDLCFRY
jgi:hypothetical protein